MSNYLCFMKKIVDILLSVVYYIPFVLLILIMHPVQWIAYNFIGKKAQQRAVQALNGGFIYTLPLLLSGSRYFNNQKIEKDKRYLIISNHQSMFDIVGILWHMRAYFPIFVSKKDLGKGIPSISYNLQKSGAALIDRKDKRQAITAIREMCKHAKEQGFSPVIFPEGSRSRTGKLKKFATAGIQVIVKEFEPDYIVPVVVRNSGKLNPKGLFPLRSLVIMSHEVMPLIPVGKDGVDVAFLESCYRNVLEQ